MKRMLAIIYIFSAAPVVAQPGFQSGERSWNGKAAPRGAEMMKRAMIDVHAKARRAYRVPALMR
jgi:hypothetical protein